MENEAGVAFGTDKTNGNHSNGEKKSRPTYTLPGVLHFIQHEWTRFEFERSQWEVERAELQARIAFLQGERKGQENLKKDLVRRIKMLEFALKQERQNYHKLKYGSDLNLPECDKNDDADQHLDSSSNEVIAKGNDLMANYRQGRQLLLQYLEEIGYTDKVLELRSARVRALLGMTTDEMNGHATDANEIIQSKGDPKMQNERIDLSSGAMFKDEEEDSKPVPVRRAPSPPAVSSSKGSPKQEQEVQIDASASKGEEEALASFNFLPEDEQSDMVEEEEEDRPVDGNTMVSIERVNHYGTYETARSDSRESLDAPMKSDRGNSLRDEDHADNWKVDQGRMQKRIEQYKIERRAFERKFKRPNRNEIEPMLSRLSGEDNIPPPPNVPAPPVPPGEEASQKIGGNSNAIDDGPPLVIPNDALDGIALGDLAGLTVSNEAGPLAMEFSGKDDLRKTWIPKYTLRSHFDGVRAVCFHPSESALITASEDHTLKMWTLQKNTPNKRHISDVDPISTFRGHSGPVLCAVVSSDGTVCYSGGLDATIQCWYLPSFNTDQFAPYDPHVLGSAMVAHTDAVWSLALQKETDQLLSCAADGTCRLWNPSLHSPLVCTYSDESGDLGIPTSVTFISTDTGQMAASYTSAECVVYDLATAKPVLKLDSAKTYNGTSATQINKIISHPTLPVLITAHEDRHIRFFDVNTGKQFHSMVAHLDAVTSLSVDPSGLFLLSGSHDGSIRLWSMDNKTCIQEITAHRKKFDEAVFDVAFHPSQPFIASAGADALAKVFV